MRPSLFLVPTVVVLACAAACQPADTPTSAAAMPTGAERVVHYRCADATVQATFRGADSATVVIDGQTHAMSAVPSASGARYEDTRGTVLWTRGAEEATLSITGQENRNCVAIDAAEAATTAMAGTPDAVAAAANAGFRATGSSPRWLAQVNTSGAQGMRIELDEGASIHHVDAPSQGVDGWAGATADGTPVRLVVQRAPCEDAGSGETFEATAMLTVGTRQLHGCGSFVAAR